MFIGIGNAIGNYYRRQAYSEEYQAVLDRATALGYTQPSTEQKVKQNTLVQSLKDAGIWDLLDVFYVFATDGSSDFATLNWKASSSFQCTKVNSPTFTANQGFNGDGTTSYLNSNFILSNGVNYTLNSASIIVGVNTNIASSGDVEFGAANSAVNRTILNSARSSGGIVADYSINNDLIPNTPNAAGSVGNWLVQRRASNDFRLWKNGTQIGSNADLSTSVPTVSIAILAENSAGTFINFSARQNTHFAVGASLSGKEASMHTIWNTYFTSL